ncbi:MAG: sigma-54-dependent Fis family transcriptional regulator [Clostridiales bacterium]|nr:MAG: sigma-54-dependent Fis family transcriptional regulator [Clostridiales bacterium]
MKKEMEVILDSTHDAMIAVDKSGIITLFNKAAQRLTKINYEDAIEKHVEGVILNTRLPYILKTGKSELNRKQPLGEINIITNRMPVKNENGEVIGAVAVFRDITEVLELGSQVTSLKEMTSMFKGIFDSTHDAISVVDQDGYGVLVNRAYTKVTGLTSADVMGKHCTVDIAEGESIHLKVLETGKSIMGERMLVGPNRREVVVDAAPIIINSQLKGSVAVIHDFTEIKRLTNELDQAKSIIRKLEAKYTFEDIIGEHTRIADAINKARIAAATPATVILRGESGTGKELFAHAIHNASDRKYSQFVKVNCASINENLLESELFGYEEGAFTGAAKGGRIGLFERGNGGTIFLDEIGEISMGTQVKILRVLQEKEIIRVGGNKSIAIDVRILAATNKNLEKAVAKGQFREDLYYRLNVIPVVIPPLRERKSDISKLVKNFMRKFNQEYGRLAKDISPEALEILELYDWPGNIRELENVIGRAMISMVSNESEIKSYHLPQLIEEAVHSKVALLKEQPSEISKMGKLSDRMDAFERNYLLRILEINEGNRKKTAGDLGISLRSLYYKLEKYGLHQMQEIAK